MSSIFSMTAEQLSATPCRGERLRKMRELIRTTGTTNGRALGAVAGVPTNYVRAMLGRDIEAGRVRVTPRTGGRPSLYEWTGKAEESSRVRSQIEWLEQLGYTVLRPGEQQ